MIRATGGESAEVGPPAGSGALQRQRQAMDALHGARGAGLILRMILIVALIAAALVLFRGLLAAAVADSATGFCRYVGLCA